MSEMKNYVWGERVNLYFSNVKVLFFPLLPRMYHINFDNEHASPHVFREITDQVH